MGHLEKGEGGASLPSPVEAYKLFVPGIKGLLVKTRNALEESKDFFVDPEDSAYVDFREAEESETYKPLYDLIRETLRCIRMIRSCVRKDKAAQNPEQLGVQVGGLLEELYLQSPHFSRLDAEQKKDKDTFELIPSTDEVVWSLESESDDAIQQMSEEMREVFLGLKKVLENAEAFIEKYL